MQRVKAYLGTALCLVFNRIWLEPEKAGDVLAECAIEACKDIFPDSSSTNGTMSKIRKDWLCKFHKGFNAKIQGGS
jgi:hypothetical protein